MQAATRAERADLPCLRLGVTACACKRHPFDAFSRWRLAGCCERTPGAGACPESNHWPQPGHRCVLFRHRFRGDGRHPEGCWALAGDSACFQWRHFAPAATLTLDVARAHGGCRLGPPGWLLNLKNVPALPAGADRPVALGAGRRCRRYIDQFDKTPRPLAPHLLLAGRRGWCSIWSRHSWPG